MRRASHTDPYVLYLTQPDGSKPVRIEQDHVPVAVTPTEASERREQIAQRMKRVNPAWTWTGPAIPSQKLAYRAILVGRDGRIWVSLSTPTEPIPETELLPVREGAPPTVRLTTREPVVYDVYDVYDVFSSSGRLLGRVALPLKTTLYTMEGAHAWGVQRDSLEWRTRCDSGSSLHARPGAEKGQSSRPSSHLTHQTSRLSRIEYGRNTGYAGTCPRGHCNRHHFFDSRSQAIPRIREGGRTCFVRCDDGADARHVGSYFCSISAHGRCACGHSTSLG